MISGLVGMLKDLGLPYVKQRGNEVWASCPACQDSGNSWSANMVNGSHSCFSCGFRGGLDMLVVERKGYSLWEADTYIRSFGLELPDYETVVEMLTPEPERRARSTIGFVPRVKIAAYKDVPDDMIAKRRLTRESVDHFGVRWDPEDEAWILPIKDEAGDLLGWQSKSPDAVRNRPVDVPKKTSLFGVERLSILGAPLLDTLAIVESQLDVVYLHNLGVPAASSMGAAVSDEQMRLAQRHCRTILLALDNDDPGRKNTYRIAASWASKVDLKIIDYAPGDPKDPGEMSAVQVARAFTGVNALKWLGAHREFRSDPLRLPKGVRREDDKRRAPVGGGRNGARKDLYVDRRRRKTY